MQIWTLFHSWKWKIGENFFTIFSPPGVKKEFLWQNIHQCFPKLISILSENNGLCKGIQIYLRTLLWVELHWIVLLNLYNLIILGRKDDCINESIMSLNNWESLNRQKKFRILKIKDYYADSTHSFIGYYTYDRILFCLLSKNKRSINLTHVLINIFLFLCSFTIQEVID